MIYKKLWSRCLGIRTRPEVRQQRTYFCNRVNYNFYKIHRTQMTWRQTAELDVDGSLMVMGQTAKAVVKDRLQKKIVAA